MKRVLVASFLALLLIPTSVPAQTATDKLIQGIKAYNDLQWEDAIKSLNDALQLSLSETSQIQAHKYLGFCYIETNQLDKAKKEFENLLNLDPDFDSDISSRYRDIFKIVRSELDGSTSTDKTQRVGINTGSIYAESIPPSAQVSLDSILQEGRTPITIEDVIAGRHLLKLILDGYRDWEEEIDVKAEKTVEFSAKLIPMPQPVPTVKKGGRLKWYLLGGTVVAAGGAVAAFLLLKDDNGGSPGEVEDDSHKTTSLVITISIP